MEDILLQEQLKVEGADIIATAKAAGFLISSQDLESHRQYLSDSDLEQAAGGSQDSRNNCVSYTNPQGRCCAPIGWWLHG